MMTIVTTSVASCSPSYKILNAVIISLLEVLLPLSISLVFACKLSPIITFVQAAAT